MKPVIADKSLGVVYDTAMEEQLRNGTAPALVATAYGPYVDTLSEPVAITRWSEESCDWNVFVATNRGRFLPDGADDLKVLEVSDYGRCIVTIPSRHRGQEVRASRTGNTTAENNEPSTSGIRPVSFSSPAASAASQGSAAAVSEAASSVVRSTVIAEPLSPVQFHNGVSDFIERSRLRDVLVFVHGFNVSFDDAVTRAAQLSLDMPFNGAVVAYCWPSQGGINSYDEDEAVNHESVKPFTEFLVNLRSSIPTDARIHLVVHSMGNRLVLKSLRNLSAADGGETSRSRTGRLVSNLVLCAPDVGLSDFRAWMPDVVPQCERVTLYANSSDTALIASKSLHAEPRAGDARFMPIIDGVETIDCSRIDMSFMGHSYYGSNPDVLTDLFAILRENSGAQDRPHLKRRWTRRGHYWEFARPAGTILCTWHFDDREEP
ncbi:MAG: alpha/beta fold hydrolase [Planctomycetaceae bacterium]